MFDLESEWTLPHPCPSPYFLVPTSPFAQKDDEKEDEISVEESNGTDPVATSATNADSNEVEQEFLESENETNSQDKLLGELFSCTIHLL